jgi:hypothetical protein
MKTIEKGPWIAREETRLDNTSSKINRPIHYSRMIQTFIITQTTAKQLKSF